MYMYMYIHVLMREGRKKEASKVKQTTRQSNTAHPRQSLFLRKMCCLGWDLNPRHSILYTLHSRQSALPLSYRGSFSWLGPHVRVRVFVQHSSIGIAIAIGLHVHVHQKHKVNLPTAAIWLRKVDIQPTCCLHMLFVHFVCTCL